MESKSLTNEGRNPESVGLFMDLIAKHEGLAEELQADYTPEEYYENFVKDSENQLIKPKSLTQRIGKKELVELIARQCKYKKHEVQDVLEGFWHVLNYQLEQGREFDFGGIFTARLYKPHPRRLWDNNKQDFKISSARPRLKLQPTPEYARYLWRGIHCPVNYMPAETVNSPPKLKAEFTAIWSQAYDLWYTEDQRRKAKKLEEDLIEQSSISDKP